VTVVPFDLPTEGEGFSPMIGGASEIAGGQKFDRFG
jgi:hypothetical protein